VVSFKEILEVFFSIHDPTTLDRQGGDVGPQYRSAIFYQSDQQKAIAEMLIQELDGASTWGSPIVTKVMPLTTFYPAEDYHQEYYRNNKTQPYCQAVITPKLTKFRKQYLTQLKQTPNE
jgi:peptide-methionine (S)-S-oxide reductase